METHDDLPMKSNMIDHDFLGKTPTHIPMKSNTIDNNFFVNTPTHNRGAPSLDLSAFMNEIQATIEEGAQEAGIMVSPVVSKQLAEEVIDNVATQARQKAENMLKRSMKTWRRNKLNEKSRKSLF